MDIYYDGDCPFCSQYVRLIKLTETVGQVNLTNLREDSAARDFLLAKGYDLDKGMLVLLNGTYYAGADAVNILSRFSSGSDAFNQINYWLLSNKYLAVIIYPLLRMVRNITLFILGRALISNHTSPVLQLFIVCWGIFSVLHLLIYAYHFGVPVYWGTYAIGGLGAWLILRPHAGRVFLVLMIVAMVDAWQHMPIFSNHTNIKNFFLLGFFIAGLVALFKGERLGWIFEGIIPVGRALLLIMYIFGVFHKINTDFLNPQVSCAITLWDQMPWPLYLLRNGWADNVYIYATLIIESLIFLCLLVPRWRYMGIVVGISFHMMLALSSYSLYATFSMLSLTLHVLFISPSAARKILDSALARKYFEFIATPLGISAVVAYLACLGFAATRFDYSLVALIWFLWAIPFLWLVIKYGKDDDDERTWGIFISSRFYLNIIPVFFFFSCFAPYLGLKTAQAVNMFANLRLEANVSNHLLIGTSWQKFDYLKDMVTITSSSGVSYFDYIRSQDLSLVYYDFLNHMERNPGAVVSYRRGDELFENVTYQDLEAEMERLLHPRWFRKWFHFIPVDTRLPKPCALNR